MKMKFIYVTVALLISQIALAEEQPCADGGVSVGGAAVGALTSVARRMPAGGCPNLAKLDGICGDVYQRTQDRSGSQYYAYAYERKIYEAACVDFTKDTPAEARTKLQQLWDNHQDEFKCNAANFQVARGSILKYAVEMRSFNLLDNAMKSWKLNLNYVDPSDQRTLLDFVQLKIMQNKGSPYEQILKGYFDELRRRGAKLKSELSV